MVTLRNELDLLLMRLTGDVKIIYFSVKQNSHLFDQFLHSLVSSITDQCLIGVFDAFSFHFPEMLREFCRICLTLVLEGIAMLVKLIFKCIFCKTF